MDAATTNDLNNNGGITLPTADDEEIEDRTWVSRAYWIGASYTKTSMYDNQDQNNEEWTGNRTTENKTVSQGDYFETDPSGTWGDGTAMSASVTKGLLTDAK